MLLAETGNRDEAADTRQVGGNPLTSAHRTACKKAGIDQFRIHDWRHHFAVWFLKRGGNLRALCQIAGWSSMRMIQRYAVFEQSDLDAVMTKTAANESATPSVNDRAA